MSLPKSEGVQQPTNETFVDSYHPLNPDSTSLEDYNRTMLHHTQQQISSSVDMSDSRDGSGPKSRSSEHSDVSDQGSSES
ncbi:unnamed protein product [Penicillium salamii]|uniref:Uncharacterized protein n=1 Tax=Penicillium salamii TaxID=1612424 RepID=A0A9W4I402_9EURO|nr:unnamed protein product [Penicillium salamii]CAG7986220.1 unnamed protein product [Penicillium salamii]CAG7994485.1 unnamed protein product [Penicillium salamii]CAG8003007.1 unnamed protein product [Penicillium salamii]CAG8074675.1 unnamed protein product [Penicillium salamii]